jgi:hypothetical protein
MPSDVTTHDCVGQQDELYDGFAVDRVVAPQDRTKWGGDVLLETGGHHADELGACLTLLCRLTARRLVITFVPTTGRTLEE